MSINMDNLVGAFEILLFGWPGVFLVLFILYVVSLGLLKFFPKK
ncbi:OadG-related small transporter subunit [Jeotgalibaca caeni]|nr:OadG-related small transporter subunit [Jeotgalibaca caeni]MDE1547991.1 OadG-related small transporter subunit [Jeotgalibaca caeni]